jgi:hypothetical protein
MRSAQRASTGWRTPVVQGFDDSVTRKEWGNVEGGKALAAVPFLPAEGLAVAGKGSVSFSTCQLARMGA